MRSCSRAGARGRFDRSHQPSRPRDPNQPDWAEIDSLVRLEDLEKEELLAAEKPIMAHGLSVFKFAYAAQRTYEETALEQLGVRQPDLTLLLLIAADPISHTFWHYYEPDRFPGVDAEDAKRLGSLIPAIYRHNDRYLGRLLERVDRKRTVVMIVSDHGFGASGASPKQVPADRYEQFRARALAKGLVTIGQSGTHRLEGVFIAAGGPIRRGVKVRARIADVAPTVLALLGLPVGRDMEGRALVEIIDPEFLEDHPVSYIDSYESYIALDRLRRNVGLDDGEMLDQLRALGYIR